MNAIRALLYADARSIVNQLHEIRRHPGRAVLWALWILFLGGFITLRLVAPFGHGARQQFGALLRTDAIVCAAAVYLGVLLISGRAMTGLFAHVAEARFIIAAPISPVTATLYIQFREILRRGARMLLTAGYLILIYLPGNVPPAAIARDLLYVLGGFIALASVPLPRRLLHGFGAAVASAAGATCLLFAITPLVRDAALILPLPAAARSVLLRLPNWHPGVLLTEPADVHSGLVFAAFLVLTALAFTVLARTARDAYPELFALSLERFDRVQRFRSRRLGLASGRVVHSRAPQPSGTHVPPAAAGPRNIPGGAAVYVWRAWTNYRRSTSPRWSGIETALLLIAGFAVGRFGREWMSGIASTSIALANFALIFAIGASSRMGVELRKPLFWLSGATLFERLAALALGDCWRVLAWCLLFAIGLVTGGAPPIADIAALLVAPSLVLLAVSAGYALYGMFPNDVDQRGPLAIVRVLLVYAMIAPAAAAGIGSAILFSSASGALLIAAAVAVTEAALLIGFASWRLDRAATLPRN